LAIIRNFVLVLSIQNLPCLSPKQLLAEFQETSFYHIICKAIDGKKLFLNDDNRQYFFKRYQDFSSGFIDTYAFCLLDNHVHLLIKTNSEKAILAHINQLDKEKTTSTYKRFIQQECSFHELIEQQLNRFFISYCLSFNKVNNIKGHLFNRPFKRIEIKDNSHLTQLFIYIHANAMKHGIIKDFTTHKWSSYQAIISDKPTHIKREEVLEWFGGRERFITAHIEMSDYFYDHPLGGE
jgi:putative transposase